MLVSDRSDVINKALYGLGTFLRNNVEARRSFHEHGGLTVLQANVQQAPLPGPLKIKILDLLGDLLRLDHLGPEALVNFML